MNKVGVPKQFIVLSNTLLSCHRVQAFKEFNGYIYETLICTKCNILVFIRAG